MTFGQIRSHDEPLISSQSAEADGCKPFVEIVSRPLVGAYPNIASQRRPDVLIGPVG